MNERGQTAHDFLIGASVLLLTILGVFGAAPHLQVAVDYDVAVGQLDAPFAQSVGPDEEAMADEFADRLVAVHRSDGLSNTLAFDALSANVTSESALRDLARSSGVPDAKVHNVTLQDGARTVLSGGSSYYANTSVAATSVRVVRFDGTRCTPTCRLIVRVWS